MGSTGSFLFLVASTLHHKYSLTVYQIPRHFWSCCFSLNKNMCNNVLQKFFIFVRLQDLVILTQYTIKNNKSHVRFILSLFIYNLCHLHVLRFFHLYISVVFLG